MIVQQYSSFGKLNQQAQFYVTSHFQSTLSSVHILNPPSNSEQMDHTYVVQFPWRENYIPLPSNRNICEGQAQSLACKLKHSPVLLKQYEAIIAEQLRHGFIEKVIESEIPTDCYFIPHHSVKKNSATTPLRIIYNCSCRQSPTHKDCLHEGPPFINNQCTYNPHQISCPQYWDCR